MSCHGCGQANVPALRRMLKYTQHTGSAIPVKKTRCNQCGRMLEERAHRFNQSWVRRMWCSTCKVAY